MTEPVVYRRRRSAISRTEREWRVEDDALVTRGGSGRERRYRWSDIVSVRLLHDPVRTRPWRYVFELQPKHARKIVIDNAHYLGERAFEERSEEYTPFVRAAVARWAAEHPKGRALSLRQRRQRRGDVAPRGKRFFCPRTARGCLRDRIRQLALDRRAPLART